MKITQVNEQTIATIREMELKLYSVYNRRDWTYKNGPIPQDVLQTPTIEEVKYSELAQAWIDAYYKTQRAMYDLQRYQEGFDFTVERRYDKLADGKWGYTSDSVAVFKTKYESAKQTVLDKFAAAEVLIQELAQIEMAGGRTEYELYEQLMYQISSFNSQVVWLQTFAVEIDEKIAKVSARKAELKARRLARKEWAKQPSKLDAVIENLLAENGEQSA